MTQKTLTISTLSPVHIGCDEVYEPSNFVIHDGQLHALNLADLGEALTQADRDELKRRADQRDPIGALQQFFRNNAERFAGIAQHQVDVVEAIVREYEQKAGRAVQSGPNGNATYNVFPIARTAFNPIDNAPYLPGSSLKGSIRTAWLNHVNRRAPLTADERTDNRNAHRALQERLLGYTSRTLEADPFRRVRLADSHPDADEAPPTRVRSSHHGTTGVGKQDRQAIGHHDGADHTGISRHAGVCFGVVGGRGGQGSHARAMHLA